MNKGDIIVCVRRYPDFTIGKQYTIHYSTSTNFLFNDNGGIYYIGLTGADINSTFKLLQEYRDELIDNILIHEARTI